MEHRAYTMYKTPQNKMSYDAIRCFVLWKQHFFKTNTKTENVWLNQLQTIDAKQ